MPAPYQNVSAAAVPIIAKNPPPEGFQQAKLSFTLTPINFAQSAVVPLNTAASGGGLSQVLSLYIDNSQNAQALTVIHGALNETIIVPAGGGAIIPTSVLKSPSPEYTIANVSVPLTPTNTVTVNITLYNFFVPPAIYGNTVITVTNTISQTALDNPFYNPGCNVCRRGSGVLSVATSGNVATAAAQIVSNNFYTLDLWRVVPFGAGVSVLQSGSIGLSLKSLEIEGAASNTGVQIQKRILSFDATPFVGQTVVLQFKIFNGLGMAIVPTLNWSYCSSQDNFSSLISDFTSNMQSCADGATTTCAIAFVVPSGATGAQVSIDVGAMSSGTLQISEIDMELSPGTSPGLVASPPQPRLTSFSVDLDSTNFFVDSSYGDSDPATPGTSSQATLACLGYIGSGGISWAGHGLRFKRNMFATPTLFIWDRVGNSDKVSGYGGGAGAWVDNVAPYQLPISISSQGLSAMAADGINALNGNGVFINYLATAEP